MKTVTLIAHARPLYTAQAIGALAEALLKPDDQVFDKLIFSIDPGSDEVVAICERASEMLAESGVIECAVYVNVSKFGIAGNTLVALQRAFEEHDSDFNLSIEDDALLTPDAAILANWFYETNGGPASDYALMSMCNHRAFGRGNNLGKIPDDPSFLAETPYITSPFAWCTTRWQWPYIESTWNKKVLPPNGWDFSLSYAMRLKGMRALHPVLSRCKNIGREGGSNETPESFDKLQTGIAYSNGEYPGPYRVVARVPDEELRKIDPWMRTEYERMHKDVPTIEELDARFPSETHKLQKFRNNLSEVAHLAGDLAEFGTYNGGGARQLSVLDSARKVYVFDTFSGLPDEDFGGAEDSANPPGRWAPLAGPEVLFEGIPNIVAVVGRFEETLQTMSGNLRLVLVHIDCDWYASYCQVLAFLEEHLVPGGIIIMDDYHNGGCLGADRAVDEWLAKMGTRARHVETDKIVFLG